MKRLCLFCFLPIMAIVTGCVTEPEDPAEISVSSSYLIVTTAGMLFESGNVAVIATSDFSSSTDLLSLHGDNGVAVNGEAIYLIERGGPDNILRFNDVNIEAGSMQYQQSVGSAVNIQDIAFVDGSKAYLSQYASAYMTIVDLGTGGVTDSISLGASEYIHNGESVPYMSDMIRIGDMVYVAIQRLAVRQGIFGPAPQVADLMGMIVVVSTADDSVVAEIELTKGNPSSMDTAGGYLYVSSTGSWADETDGGIEKIDPSTNTNMGVVVGEESFGGSITTLKAVNATQAYVYVGKSDAEFNYWTELVEIDLGDGAVGDKVEGVDDAFGGIAYDGHYLYVGDRSTSDPGVVVIDPSDNSTVAGPIDVGALPPSSIAVITVQE
ncbi:MAG: hypothetical protein GF331_00695 [Chitinivibrionales bacterium]|nr:hypothetical protein [Chitinivibrionales bacterium]